MACGGNSSICLEEMHLGIYETDATGTAASPSRIFLKFTPVVPGTIGNTCIIPLCNWRIRPNHAHRMNWYNSLVQLTMKHRRLHITDITWQGRQLPRHYGPDTALRTRPRRHICDSPQEQTLHTKRCCSSTNRQTVRSRGRVHTSGWSRKSVTLAFA